MRDWAVTHNRTAPLPHRGRGGTKRASAWWVRGRPRVTPHSCLLLSPNLCSSLRLLPGGLTRCGRVRLGEDTSDCTAQHANPHVLGNVDEIGRASCRERVVTSVDAGS